MQLQRENLINPVQLSYSGVQSGIAQLSLLSRQKKCHSLRAIILLAHLGRTSPAMDINGPNL